VVVASWSPSSIFDKIPIGRECENSFERAKPSGSDLFFDDPFDLADMLLDLSGYLFTKTTAFQVAIVRQSAHLFPTLALHFVKLARYLVLSTWLRLVAFFEKI
jgi:hypothetical protein